MENAVGEDRLEEEGPDVRQDVSSRRDVPFILEEARKRMLPKGYDPTRPLEEQTRGIRQFHTWVGRIEAFQELQMLCGEEPMVTVRSGPHPGALPAFPVAPRLSDPCFLPGHRSPE